MHPEELDQHFIIHAASIDERLSPEFTAIPGQRSDENIATQRLAAWCKASAAGDWEQFGRRLARDNYTLEFVLSRLGAIELADPSHVPDWVVDSIWIFDISRQIELPPINHSAVYPFEELLSPIVMVCSTRLWNELDHLDIGWISQSAANNLNEELLGRLSALCCTHLYREFDAFRSDFMANSTLFTQLSPDSTLVYERFLSFMAGKGLERLFRDKPVLLRLVATVVRQWLDSTSEFVSRLGKDLAQIRREFGKSHAVVHVVQIESRLSDLHHGGRSVKAVTLADETQFIYKPRCVEAELRWSELVKYTNSIDPPIDLHAPSVLSMKGYGWVKYISSAQMTGDESAALYYQRAGALLALFHVLCATDMHDENLIACGEYPVAIDLEMLLQPASSGLWTNDTAMRAHEFATKRIQDSVAFIGMLPSLARVPAGRAVRLGGLEEGSISSPFVGWAHPNSDAMRPQRNNFTPSTPKNVPRRNGKSIRLDTYLEEFITGFLEYSNFLLRMRDTDPEAVSHVLDRFSGAEVRRIQHPTRFYDLLLRRMRTHKHMDDGAIWSAEADFVARFADWDRDIDNMWPLRKCERADLINLNVPKFTVATTSRTLCHDGQSICELPDAPGITRARHRFEMLTPEDLKWQELIIRQSSASTLHVGSLRRSTPVLTRPELKMVGSALSADDGLEEASRLFRSIHGSAIRKGNGAAWIGLDWVSDSEMCSVGVLGPDLYNGLCGISLFCAAFGKIANADSATDLALFCLSSIRGALSGPTAARTARGLGLGAGTGLGSVIYALCLISQFTGRSELIDDAMRAAELISTDLIDSDRVLDVLSGSAGAILGLLRLHSEVGEASILDRAIQCGDHLLSKPRVGLPGCRSWPGTERQEVALTGMSHGAAGFALSLGSLYRASGEERFLKAATDCVDYENSTYDELAQNWPDLRDPRGSLFLSQWCHGAVGIGLSRVSLLDIPNVSKPALKLDIERACQANDLSWPQRSDTMCCGTLGSVELLRAVGKRLEDKNLCMRAEMQLASVVRAADRSNYKWQIGDTDFNVGLFRGQSGVGYSILRGIDPELPNVLVWE